MVANIEILRQIVKLEFPHPDQMFRYMLAHDRRKMRGKTPDFTSAARHGSRQSPCLLPTRSKPPGKGAHQLCDKRKDLMASSPLGES